MANLCPYFSVIVPITDQNVHLLPFTMDSIAGQTCDAFEVIIIDGQAKEHSLSIFDAYRSCIARIYTALDRNLSGMLNKGVELSKGNFLHFLQPGEFYISRNSFQFMKEFINNESDPDLIYTGCVIRHSMMRPQQIFRQIEHEDLKGAKTPYSLQAYWFKKKSLVMAGKFNTAYRIQGGFDLICRLYRDPTLRKAFMKRILTDYEYRLPKRNWILRQVYETLLIIFRHFGLSKAVIFWIAQNQLRLLLWWSKSIQGAFWKRSN
jgi:glycosyltransferase involved in cell wall biosynthesis